MEKGEKRYDTRTFSTAQQGQKGRKKADLEGGALAEHSDKKK